MRYITLFFFVFFCLGSRLHAFEDIPPCFKELELSFFEPQLVNQALSSWAGYQQYQNTWPLINSELQRRSANVPDIVKYKARQMSPVPLDYPFQVEAASKILWSTLYELFSIVLKEYGINDDGDITGMFNYIRSHQEKRLQVCLGIPEENQRPK